MGRNDHTSYLYAVMTNVCKVTQTKKMHLGGNIHRRCSLGHFKELFEPRFKEVANSQIKSPYLLQRQRVHPAGEFPK